MKTMRNRRPALLPVRRVAAVRRMMMACLAGLTLVSGGLSAALAAGNSVESVTSVQQGNTTWVRIGFASEISASPVSFAVSNPPRVALDFADTANRSGRSSIDLPTGDVRSAAIVQSGERTRIVLNLKRALGYETTIDGKTLVVALQPTSSAAPVLHSSSGRDQTPEAAASAPKALRAVDFRRGDRGEGRVVIDLSDPGMNVDIRREGQTIVADFIGAELPANLQKELDVGDFATPVRTVRAFRHGANTRLVIEPRGTWEHNAYQSDTQFVIEVAAVQDDPAHAGASSRPRYSGERLSLNFQNVEIRALLQVIADFTDLNIVTSDSVQGNITLRLKDVPWDQALAIILESRALGMRRTGNVIEIAPREELADRDKREFEERAQIAQIEPLRTETFQLNYQKADALKSLLVSDKQRVLSARGSVVVDQRTNKVFVQDTPSRLEEVRRVIAQVDIPVRQVLIEARIVEADDRFSRNLGVRLGFNRINSRIGGSDSVRGSISGNLQGVHDLTGLPNLTSTTGRTALPNMNFVNLPAAPMPGSGTEPASFALSLFNPGMTKFLNLELSALEADQRGKVISSPRVLTADQRTAIIEQGTELPYKKDDGNAGTSIVFKKASLILEVTPQITPEGSVILDVKVNRDAVGMMTPEGFAIDTRRVETQVLVENGGTVVIGGIYEQVERNQVEKVPLLGDIPVIGHAFKSNARTNNRNELLVFLTPRIVVETAMAN